MRKPFPSLLYDLFGELVLRHVVLTIFSDDDLTLFLLVAICFHVFEVKIGVLFLFKSIEQVQEDGLEGHCMRDLDVDVSLKVCAGSRRAGTVLSTMSSY